MNVRVKKIRQLLRGNNCDALLVTLDSNVSYLSCIPSSESWLLITKTKSYYITDFRYIYEVKKSLKGFKLVCYRTSLYDAVGQLTRENKIKHLGYNPDSLTVTQFGRLKRSIHNKSSLIKTKRLVEQLREVKEKQEIAKIKKALRIHHGALKYLKRVIRPGISEQDVLRKLESYVKSKGCGFSFDPIIASGPNSCYPHASVTKRKIKNNEPVLVDMGIDVDGYKSDLTRMFFLGKISELILDVNKKVKEAQQRAIGIIKPGVKISEIDNQARNYLKENKLDSYFGHALGHGVGLDIHEDPRIASTNSGVLKENMVITIEPGVYIPEKFGIRLEEMVLVTKTGYKVLSGNIN